MTHDELLQLIDQAAAEGWTELDLSSQGLTELPPEIGKLTQLETLILGKMIWCAYGDDGFQTFYTSLLKENPLPKNSISHLPKELTLLSRLRTLILDGNPLGEIPESVTKITSLENISAIDTGLKEINPKISRLENLKKIVLRGNQIEDLSKGLEQLRRLEELDLCGNCLTTVPNFIFSLNSLKILTFSANQITSLTEEIQENTVLANLALDYNQIEGIPNCITELKNLRSLNLSGNQISHASDAIGNIQSLLYLDLSFNRLELVPTSINQLRNLRTLVLHSNKIKDVPAFICELEELENIIFGWNQIESIPDEIICLKELQEIDFSHNKINAIPRNMNRLKRLKRLDLASNKIEIFPIELSGLQEIESIDLQSNSILYIPKEIMLLTNLNYLDLRNNPLPISPEILGAPDLNDSPGSVEGIFNYLKELYGGKVKPLNEAKMLLVGQPLVGKTSLVNRLVDNHYNRDESQTDGLSVCSWSIHVNSKDVRLNVWDFGGQEIYHHTHQFFLTKRSLYVLVCNCRTSEEENRIEYWLKLIQSFGDESPVIIVGNKSDEQPFDINRKALRQKYPNICAILETSCQSGDGIDNLRTKITEEVGKLREVYDLLPLSWFQVKEQLEALDKDFISYGEYIGICYQNNIPEEQNQTQLIDLLHNLGLVLNFRNHPFLQNTNVLNPDWVTEGIYALLSDDILKLQGKGILDYDDLSRALDVGRYPCDRHRYLTDLMQEFQLCFELPDCPCPRFLIPGLLPKDEPEETGLEGDTLEFQYHYRILPESVLSRFIVLSHEKIHNQVHWRSGVMLAYCEGDEVCNIARVKADPEDKKIFISISGRETTRRVFLALIRDTFTKIHKSFADLEVTEWVPVPNNPDHPPLDYQELLGLEAMGEQTVTIGKLRLRLNLRQLLDGYEPLEARRQRDLKERGLDIEERYGDIYIHQGSRATHQHGGGDNVAGDLVQGDKHSQP